MFLLLVSSLDPTHTDRLVLAETHTCHILHSAFDRHEADPFFEPHVRLALETSIVLRLRSLFVNQTNEPTFTSFPSSSASVIDTFHPLALSQSSFHWHAADPSWTICHPAPWSLIRFFFPGTVSSKRWMIEETCSFDETVQFARNCEHCSAASCCCCGSSGVFHAVDSTALQGAHRCTPAPDGMLAVPAVLPTLGHFSLLVLLTSGQICPSVWFNCRWVSVQLQLVCTFSAAPNKPHA